MPSRPALARGPVGAIAVASGGLLLAMAGRYGYHRDELYFLTAGRHLAWGYPDQPPLVPALARAADAIDPGSLTLLRLPSVLAAIGIVLVTGLLARDLGGTRAAQALAAGAMAVSTILYGASHLLSTTTFDLLGWSVLTWLFVRILVTGEQRWWPLAGVVAGATLLANSLAAFLVAAFLTGIVLSGPRRSLLTAWPWVSGLVAGVMWSPYLAWQAHHGWPQLEVARAIADGGSGTSAPRWLLLPYQLVLVSPWLTPLWLAGAVRLFRDARLRALAWTYPLLVLAFVLTGGKPYYLGGMFPLLLAAGAGPTVAWLRDGRRGLAVVAFVLSLPGLIVTLPIVPVGEVHRLSIEKVNYDVGETIGWPSYVEQIATVYRQIPAAERPAAAIVTSNYGEAGAVDRFGAALGLPPAFSGHNGYWYWGPPPAATSTVVAVGFDQATLERSFADVRAGARLDNPYGVDNDERGALVLVCRGPRADWSALWPRFMRTG